MKMSYIPKESFESLLSLELDPKYKSKILSDLCRINIMYMINSAGSGHLGSSFSSIDIMSWIMSEYVIKNNHNYFFSSKGHDAPAIYNVMIALGLLDFSNLNKLRKVDGLPGHPDINTPNIVTNTGSLGMGISKAKGFIKSNRLKGNECRVFVMTGDGELQEGQIWESLNRLEQENMKELTVIVDHNKFQSDRKVSVTSNLGNLEDKFKSFGLETITCNGNDINEFSSSLDNLVKSQKPGVLISNTVKGSGVDIMEGTKLKDQDFYKFHSGAIPKEIYENSVDLLTNKIKDFTNQNRLNYSFKLITNNSSEISKPHLKTQSLISSYSKSLIKESVANNKIVTLDGDLILDTGLIEFEKLFPDRFFECGIAEQDMVSQAGTLALEGFIPVVHSFASFLSSRPNEQIYNNATEETKIIYVGSLAGLLPGGPGHSHQAVRDIASLSGMPNFEIIQPGTELEASLAISYAINETNNNVYIRLCSIPVEVPYKESKKNKLIKGEGNIICEGEDIAVITHGPVMINEAYKAIKLFENSNYKPKLISYPWMNTFSINWIDKELKSFDKIFIIDDHYLEGGLAEKFISYYSLNSTNSKKKKFFNLSADSIPVSGTNQEVLNHHSLSSKRIYERILSSLEG